jgi:hypothetical protein
LEESILLQFPNCTVAHSLNGNSYQDSQDIFVDTEKAILKVAWNHKSKAK